MQIPRFGAVYQNQPEEPSTTFSHNSKRYWATGPELAEVRQARYAVTHIATPDDWHKAIAAEDELCARLAGQAIENAPGGMLPLMRLLLENPLVEDRTGLDFLAMVFEQAKSRLTERDGSRNSLTLKEALLEWSIPVEIVKDHVADSGLTLSFCVLDMLHKMELLETLHGSSFFRLSQKGEALLREKRPELF